MRVYADHAGAKRAGHAHPAAEVARPDRGIEAIRVVVGELHGLGFRFERNLHDHWAENFFLRHAHGVVGAGEDRRRIVGAVRQTLRATAAGHNRAAFCLAERHVAVDRRPLRLRHQRADLGRRIERIANTRLERRGLERVNKRVGRASLDEHARARRAALPCVAEACLHRLARGLGDVRICENDVRALAAELERNALDVVRAELEQLGAGRGLTGKRNLVDAGMRGNAFAERCAGAGEDVEYARGHAGLDRDFAEHQRRQRRVAGRLENHRTSGCKCRRHLPGSGEEGKIPRRDRGHHAQGFPQREVEHVRAHRDRVAEELVHRAGVVLEHVGRAVDFV